MKEIEIFGTNATLNTETLEIRVPIKMPNVKKLRELHDDETVVKYHRNGSLTVECSTCNRCGGDGTLYGYMMIEGGKCFKCGGSGKHTHKYVLHSEKSIESLMKKAEINRQKELERISNLPYVQKLIAKVDENNKKYIQNKKENEAKNKQLAEKSNFVGNVKDRLEFELTVTKRLVFENYYGKTAMYIMQDKDSNVFVWSTNDFRMTESNTYQLKGTIKEHKEYNGVKQTVITRCKILNID